MLHIRGDSEVLLLHADLDVDQLNRRTERRVGPEELVLRRDPAYRDRNDALRRRSGYAGKVTAQTAVFQFILVERRLIFSG